MPAFAALTGVVAAPFLPMNPDFSIDWDSLRPYVRWIARQRPTAIAMNMDASEGPSLSRDEQIEVLRACKEAIGGACPLFSGLIAGYTADAVAWGNGLLDRGLDYVAGILPSTSVWRPGTGPLPPKAWSGRGRPPTRLLRREPGHVPVAAKELALSLPAGAWQPVSWREGTKGTPASRFAASRVRPGHRDHDRPQPWPALWLLIEWPGGEAEPSRYWLANLPADTPLARLVGLAGLRRRIERDYRELQQELGLGHYEGRGWRGFHHHASLCIAACGFLVLERARLPPGGARSPRGLAAPALPAGFRPRGSRAAAAATAARAPFDRQLAPLPGRAARAPARSVPLLRARPPHASAYRQLMTQ